MRLVVLIIILFVSLPAFSQHATKDTIPGWMKGQFVDDYGIRYNISDTAFVMSGPASYRIISWDEKGEFLLTQNAATNISDAGLYTRIDYVKLTGMQPFNWGYCFSVFNAVDAEAALKAASADRANPKQGCNGYPFSRMKRF